MLKIMIVGFASIVPGLGFFVLRRYRTSVYVFLSVMFLFLLSVFGPWEGLRELCLVILFGLWIIQIYIAIKYANMEKSQDDGKSIAPIEYDEKIKIPSNIPRSERMSYKARESVKRQLAMGENVIAGIYANRGRYSHYHLGLTENDFLIVEINFGEKPIDVKRIPISEITLFEKKSGLLADTLKITREGVKTRKYEVHMLQRDEFEKMADKVNEKILENLSETA